MEVRTSEADGLLEREHELATLDRLVGGAAAGRGGVALIEGPAGIGKTRLLAEARTRAADRMIVLSARCGQLERDFSFGAVRQLFESPAREPSARQRLLAGAAAPAGGVLDAPGADAEGAFAVLHGLYWATLNLAEERPVLLAIDDLQWCDRPSLRFVAYLTRRLEGAPVLVAATIRSTDPGTDPGLLAEIAADPLTHPVRPGPLGSGSVGSLVHDRLGADPDRAFTEACEVATGGNPLLLGQLLSALAEDGARPTADGAGAVREIGPRAVSRTVLLRLSRLPESAIAVAHAVAVLGESSGLAAVAALTGLDEAEAARGARELARADILRPDPPLGFVHPLVRDAVYGDLPAGDRELQHGRAADALVHAHATDEEVAAQLVHAPRRGDPRTVELLRSAAAGASRRGGPDSAVAYLERALAEPPPPDQRGDVLFELGMAEVEMNAPAAAEHLRGAYDQLTDPSTRAVAGFALAHSLLFTGRPAEGAALAMSTAAELPDELADDRLKMEALAALAACFGSRNVDALRRVERYRDGRPGDGLGAMAVTASAAFGWAVASGPADRCEALAVESLSGGDLLAGGGGLFWSAALVALILSDSPRTAGYLEAGREQNYRRGSVFATSSVEMWTGLHLMATGDLDDAGEALRHSLRLQEPWGSDATGSSWARGLVALHMVLTGDRASVRATLGTPPPPNDESDGANLSRAALAELLLAEGAPGDALELAELMGRAARHVTHPNWKAWLSLKGRALVALGRTDEARATFEDELELARACGAASAIGRCMRQLGELEGDAGIDRLREAVDVLASSPARLEHARALAALGGALRRARHLADARDPLRQALDLAQVCGCPPLLESVRTELAAAGARPRTTALGGAEALTASERRVATLAADGRTNREIAQALFVTPKTVEVHLSNAYRKLGIRSRRELPTALPASS